MYTITDRRSTPVRRAEGRPRRRVLGLAVALAAVVATGSSVAANTVNGSVDQTPLRHAIVFTRFVPGTDMGQVYRIDAGDTVVGRYTYRGRHTGTFLGVPASNAEIEMHTIDIWRVRDDLLAEHWDEVNTLEVFQQMGAIPSLALN